LLKLESCPAPGLGYSRLATAESCWNLAWAGHGC
jgi:hypothetical protein